MNSRHFLQLHHGENRLFFNEIMMLMMMMTLALYYARTLSWIIIVPTQSLKHQPACRHIASLKPIIQTLVIL
jgi:hypothetical protein